MQFCEPILFKTMGFVIKFLQRWPSLFQRRMNRNFNLKDLIYQSLMSEKFIFSVYSLNFSSSMLDEWKIDIFQSVPKILFLKSNGEKMNIFSNPWKILFIYFEGVWVESHIFRIFLENSILQSWLSEGLTFFKKYLKNFIFQYWVIEKL